MKKTFLFLLLLLAFLLSAGTAAAQELPVIRDPAAELPLVEELCESGETEAAGEPPLIEESLACAETETEIAEWTVMLYLCGADLESDHAFASRYLQSIASTMPDSRVRLVIETGGTETWHCGEEDGIPAASDRLQRWVYDENGFTLMDEQENASMARYTTLSSFIRWTAENYPAQKNMLVLWGPGGGSAAGFLWDEVHDGAVMSLESLERALRGGGVRFDLVLADACLMASLETCQALAPWADTLVASEELLPACGSDCAEWLQSLYDDPGCAPVRLGKLVCNAPQLLYAERRDTVNERFLSLSVIDLGRIAEVADAFNDYMAEVVSLLGDPAAFGAYRYAVSGTDRFMAREMWDLYDMARRGMKAGITKETAIRLETLVDEAVLYHIRGSHHPYSHGLSAFLCPDGSVGLLDRFARTCKNAWQLAFFDAVNVKWDSPEWVSEAVGEIPQANADRYCVAYAAEPSEDQTQAVLHISSGLDSVLDIRCDLQRYDAEEDCWYDLGRSDGSSGVRFAYGDDAVSAELTGSWLALDGELLSLVAQERLGTETLLEAPIRVRGEIRQLCILTEPGTISPLEGSRTEPVCSMIGIWHGIDPPTGLADRGICSPTELRGEVFSVCRPVYSEYLRAAGDMRFGEEKTLTSTLRVEEITLSAGQYRIRFEITDLLGREYTTDFLELIWNGESANFGGLREEREVKEGDDAQDASENAAEAGACPDEEGRIGGIGLARALLPTLHAIETEGQLSFSEERAVCTEPDACLLRIWYATAPASTSWDGQTALGEILVTNGSLRRTLKLAGLEPDTAVRIGCTDGYDVYFLTAADENSPDQADSRNTGELSRLRQALPDLLRKADVFSQTSGPEAQGTGTLPDGDGSSA